LKLAEPAWHHRTPRFMKLFKECRERLQRVFETSQSEIIVLAGSGTLAMEASMVHVIGPGRKAAVVSAGKWGERFVQICDSFGLAKSVLKLPYGKSPTPEQVAQLAKDPAVAAVYVHLCETSTGAKYDIEGIGKAVRAVNPAALLAVDAISGAVGMRCPLDEWGVDLYIVGSQKCLMMPPGLAILAVSRKAWAVIEKVKAPAYYCSLLSYRKVLPDNDTPYTPANTLIAALNEALAMIEEEGIQNVHKRHAVLAEATRAGIAALGLKLLSDVPAETCTAVLAPQGVESGKIIKTAEQRYGVKMADGQGELKGKIFRLSHMGYCSAMDMVAAMGAVELGLKSAGANVKLGTGVAAFLEVIAKAPQELVL
jgi:aspartate aminotransferase-like enzyme